MRKKLHLIAFCCLLINSTNGFSQRYLTEIFSAVNVTSDVIYGNNLSVMVSPPTCPTAPCPFDLKMDVYQPTGDTLAERPLIIFLHTGSFLPRLLNGGATGSKTDSAVVEMCTRFAKRGYVAVAADYRLGWNPTSTNQDVRTSTLINAVYRAIQDTKNCVRYFRNDVATNGNVFKIDDNKIVVGGIGSGGYISLAFATLNKVTEIQLPKFINFSQTPYVPYVDQTIAGNFDGTDATTYNTPNYASYSSSANMVFNIGGALGDSTWLEPGEGPFVSFQCYKDPYAPYETAAVTVPTTGDFVVEASGSYDVQKRAKRLGNNYIFEHSVFNDLYTTRANQVNDGYEGLFPFITPVPGAALSCTGPSADPQKEQASPWEWWDEANYMATLTFYGYTSAQATAANCSSHTSNPDMSAAKGRLYIDTIQGYLNPRIVCALGLAGCTPTGIKENEATADVRIFPNPSSADINFSVIGFNAIQKIELYDIAGRLVKQTEKLNTQQYTISREALAYGMYFIKIELNNKIIITKKIILE